MQCGKRHWAPPILRGLLLLMIVFSSQVQASEQFEPEHLAGWDWVRLDTGEWLKGEVIGLYDKILEFESDYFDTLSLDWDEVTRLKTSHSMSVRLSNGTTVLGPVDIDLEQLRFLGPVANVYQRSMIVAMTKEGDRELDLWRLDLGFGGSLKEGNVNEKSITTDLTLSRRSAISVFTTTYRADFAESNGEQTEETHRFSSRLDRFLRKRVYWTPGYGEFYRDRFKNIDTRITYGIFVGYYLVDNQDVRWSVGGGPGYQYQEFTTAPTEDEKYEKTFVVMGETVLKWDITKDITLDVQYQPQFTNVAAGRYKHVVDTSLSIDLTDRLDFELNYLWDYTDNPQVDEDGERPEKDDYTITMGLEWSL